MKMTALLIFHVVIAVLLVGCGQVQESPNKSATPTTVPGTGSQSTLPQSFAGKWTIVSWSQPGVGALSSEEANSLKGKSVDFADSVAIFDGNRCEHPGYQSDKDNFWDELKQCEIAPKAGCKFLWQEKQSIAECLGESERREPILVLNVKCESTFGLPRFYRLVSSNRLLANLDGTDFCFIRIENKSR
jgi:hypothetical protein